MAMLAPSIAACQPMLRGPRKGNGTRIGQSWVFDNPEKRSVASGRSNRVVFECVTHRCLRGLGTFESVRTRVGEGLASEIRGLAFETLPCFFGVSALSLSITRAGS